MVLLFSSLTPTAIDYNPNVSATMQQPSSVEHANYKTDNNNMDRIPNNTSLYKYTMVLVILQNRVGCILEL